MSVAGRVVTRHQIGLLKLPIAMFKISKQVANKIQITKIPNSIGGHIDYRTITVNYSLRNYNIFLLSDY